MRKMTLGRWVCGVLVLSCALLSTGCSTIAEWFAGDEWRAPRVIQVKGIESLCYHPPTWCTTARAGRPVGILARDGDLFWSVKKNFTFLIEGPTGNPWSWRRRMTCCF